MKTINTHNTADPNDKSQSVIHESKRPISPLKKEHAMAQCS